MERKDVFLELKKGLTIHIKESDEKIPQGVIIDIFHKKELVDTRTYWYDDLKSLTGGR